MKDETKFIKTGSFWKQPLWKRAWLNFRFWFAGLWMFIIVMSDYQESMVKNEMDIRGAWSLCFSIQEARMGKTYKMIIPKRESKMDA